MSRFTFLFIFLSMAGAVLVSSCDNTTSGPAPVTTPEVWGQIAAVKESWKIISGSDTTYPEKDSAKAYFYASPQVTNIYQDAGIVYLNGAQLSKNALNIYSIGGTSLDLVNNVNWQGTGAGLIPPFVFNYKDTFPDYIAPLPTEIIKSNGLTLELDSSTVAGADSVRVYIHDGVGTSYFITAFGARQGLVTISPAQLASLAFVTDYSGTVGIFPYRSKNKVFSNKGFNFLKERRRYQSINIY